MSVSTGVSGDRQHDVDCTTADVMLESVCEPHIMHTLRLHTLHEFLMALLHVHKLDAACAICVRSANANPQLRVAQGVRVAVRVVVRV